jgi:hypothetical protein
MLNYIQTNLFPNVTDEICQIENTLLHTRSRYVTRCQNIKHHVMVIALYIDNNAVGRISDIIVLNLINKFKSKINKYTHYILNMLISNLLLNYKFDDLANNYLNIEYSNKSDRKKFYDVVCNILSYFNERHEFNININFDSDDRTVASENTMISSYTNDKLCDIIIIDDMNSIKNEIVNIFNSCEQNITDQNNNINETHVIDNGANSNNDELINNESANILIPCEQSIIDQNNNIGDTCVINSEMNSNNEEPINNESIDLLNSSEQNIIDQNNNINETHVIDNDVNSIESNSDTDASASSNNSLLINCDDNVDNNFINQYTYDKKLDEIFKNEYNLINNVKGLSNNIDSMLKNEIKTASNMLDYHNRMSSLYLSIKLQLIETLNRNKIN